MSTEAEVVRTPFSRRATTWLVGVCVVSFACALMFAALGSEPGAVPDHKATSYSRSAIGHHGFTTLLEKLDIPVVISRHDSGKKAGDGLLVIAEPRTDLDDRLALADMVKQAKTVLLVLPKRAGAPMPNKKAFLEEAHFVSTDVADDVRRAVNVSGQVVRFPEKVVTTRNDLGIEPAIEDSQVIVGAGADLEPIIRTDRGILLGLSRRGDHSLWVLADPDLIENHGLAAGDNAPLAVAIIEKLREGAGGDDRPVVIDETLHGNMSTPSVWHALVEFPLVLATIAGLLCVLILLWAAMGRFGAPLPRPPAIEPGKGFLIANTAALIRLGGHSSHALSRYLATTMQDVARASHAPAELGGERLREWLEQVGRARKVTVSLRDLEAEVEQAGATARGREPRVVAAAHRIYAWRRHMTSERS